MNLESPVVNLNKSAQYIFDALCDVKNYEKDRKKRRMEQKKKDKGLNPFKKILTSDCGGGIKWYF